MREKHYRTYHFPWSEGVSSDDRVLDSTDQFNTHRVVITEKRDGECTTLYPDGYVHARSIDGNNHPWQSVIKAIWRERCYELPKGWRIVGENLYAQHTLRYDDLVDWIEIFAIITENNTVLSWKDTIEWCELLCLQTVPVLWEGIWDECKIKNIQHHLNLEIKEGYVCRISKSFEASQWNYWVGKFVRKGHVQTDEHWTKNWVPNSRGKI
jgi:hypothetical protein